MILDFFGKLGRLKEMFAVFELLHKYGLTADEASWTIVLEALAEHVCSINFH